MALRKSAIHLSVVIAINSIFGIMFNILLGRRFGISWELDCLFISLLIFNIFGIFTALVTALFIPVFNEIRSKDDREGFEFADVVFKWSLMIGFVGWISVMCAGPMIVKLFASGFDAKAVNLSAELLTILFMGYIFSNLSAVAVQILNSFFLFLVPALTGLLTPLFNIAAIFLLTPKYGTKGIAVSYIFSNVLVSAILMFYLFAKTRWRPTLKIYHSELPELFKLSSKAALSSLIWGVWDIISRNIASNLGVGIISLLAYAEKIVVSLYQIIIAPISSVFYSKVSELITLAKWDDIKQMLTKTLRINISLSIFASAGVIVFLKPLLTLLFLNSKFTVNDIRVLINITMIEITVLIIYSLETPFVRILYGTKSMNVFLFISTVGAAMFYVFANILSSRLGVYGLALSIPVSRMCVLVLYLYFANKHINTAFSEIIKTLIKNVVLATAFSFAGFFVARNIDGNVMVLFLLGPIWLSIYMAASKYVLPEEWNILRNRT